ncbi:uncharacterized protein LOC108677020 [Hyalella azteca]|uniref:Uncharacterized protein LOC108677020 n=1 Tax=Hyalella azteca TaxID=294128 RepID=A0A8B7P3G4_HYAAZ|nr:uncharacterized protein LOC108677020 [Hyalella azteca]XP_018020659.1 uncharacterized protein LOC108677020 [Hyalella azteca]
MKGLKLALITLLSTFAVGWSHVALMEPPARNVLWRAGYPNLPKHEDDDYLYCIEKEEKNCPPCGDTIDSPQPYAHQAGGKWALGIIGRNYSAGETISVGVNVTNSHGGHMVFKLCPNNDVTKPVTQECLDRYPLSASGYPDGKVPVTSPYQETQEFNLKIKLPQDVVCSQCVLQMTQYTEQFKPAKVMFRNCADIGIIDPRSASSHARQNRFASTSKSLTNGFTQQGFLDQSAGFGLAGQQQFRTALQEPSSFLTIADQLSAYGGSPQFGQLAFDNHSPQVQSSSVHSQTPTFAYEPDFMNGQFDFKSALEFNNQQSLQQVGDGNNRENFQLPSRPEFDIINSGNPQVAAANKQDQKFKTAKFLSASAPQQFSSLSPLSPQVPFTRTIQGTENFSKFQNSKQISHQIGAPFVQQKPQAVEIYGFGNVGKKQKNNAKRDSDANFAPSSSDSQFRSRSKAMFPEQGSQQSPGYILAHIY